MCSLVNNVLSDVITNRSSSIKFIPVSNIMLVVSFRYVLNRDTEQTLVLF